MDGEGPFDERLRTGIDGLDEVLRGGLIAERSYLVQGGPGTGKTTLGNHFLGGGDPGRNLFVTLGETPKQLRENARRSGLCLDDTPILDLSPMEQAAGSVGSYNLLESWEVEGGAIHDQLIEYQQANAPRRVFIDSLSQLRFLTPDTFQFRKQALSLLRQLTSAGATVLFTAEHAAETEDDDLQFLSDGVIQLRRIGSGRVCAVTKMRGSGFATGEHYYALGEKGMTVYPRLVPGEHTKWFEHETIGSGIAGLDTMARGGIERGTVTVLSGPSGVGKSTLGAHFMKEAAARDERSVIYGFDEGFPTFRHRLESMGVPISSLIEQGSLDFDAIEPLHHNPDSFAQRVRTAVEYHEARVVMIDSLSGYRQSIRGEDVRERLHALCRYLVNMGVTVILVNETHAVVGGELRATQDGISYLADTILLLRYVASGGELRKSLTILKKRTSQFDPTQREFQLDHRGVTVGEPVAVAQERAGTDQSGESGGNDGSA